MFPAHKFSCHFSLSDALPRWQSCKWKRGWKQLVFFFFFFHVDAFHAGFFLASLSHHYGGPVRTDGGLIFTAAALRERRVFSKFTHTHKHRRDLFLSLLYGRPFCGHGCICTLSVLCGMYSAFHCPALWHWGLSFTVCWQVLQFFMASVPISPEAFQPNNLAANVVLTCKFGCVLECESNSSK